MIKSAFTIPVEDACLFQNKRYSLIEILLAYLLGLTLGKKQPDMKVVNDLSALCLLLM